MNYPFVPLISSLGHLPSLSLLTVNPNNMTSYNNKLEVIDNESLLSLFEGLDDLHDDDDDMSLTSLLGTFSSKSSKEGGISTSSDYAVLQGMIPVKVLRIDAPTKEIKALEIDAPTKEIKALETDAPTKELPSEATPEDIVTDPGAAAVVVPDNSIAAKVNQFHARFLTDFSTKSSEVKPKASKTTIDGNITAATSQYHMNTMTPQRHHAMAKTLARQVCQMRSLTTTSTTNPFNYKDISKTNKPEDMTEIVTPSSGTSNSISSVSKKEKLKHFSEESTAVEEFAEEEPVISTPTSHNLAIHVSDMKQKKMNAKFRRVCVMEQLPSLCLKNDNGGGSTVSSITDIKTTDTSIASIEDVTTPEHGGPHTTTPQLSNSETMSPSQRVLMLARRRLGKGFCSDQPSSSSSKDLVKQIAVDNIKVDVLQARYVDLETKKLQLEEETERLQSQVERIKEIVASARGSTTSTKADSLPKLNKKTTMIFSSDRKEGSIFQTSENGTETENVNIPVKEASTIHSDEAENISVEGPEKERQPLGPSQLGVDKSNRRTRRERARQQLSRSRGHPSVAH